ncbi:MAG: hypothetical protein ABIH77_05715 [Pseudomonadota bacterium]|nr:hypothetical protein [Gammaproteobacteria bacterium]MBU1559178.1 hypothetical protein [Gammaproteobacteria bacterium]MBU1628991.1 hypothetical protein [Gammaproteobacteria bacterium]MBU1926424.1 hypothetical protein [Gammaproteobacteria bacterium]MBU2545594.1 hypothetical protein [Gammaproteobacteria bacterium]
MKYITASELKRRGVVVLEEQLQYGPLQIMKNSKVSCVVLSEEEYERLQACCAKQPVVFTGLSEMLEKPSTGNKSPKALSKQVAANKKEWGKS